MRRPIAYVVFAGIYGGLLLSAGFAADQFKSEALGGAVTWAAPFAVAPFALLTAMRLGRLSKLGLVATSLMLMVCTWAATVAILVAIAVPVVGGPAYEYVAGMFASYFVIGGGQLLLSSVFLWQPLYFGQHC
jgi:hypothetical protein